MCLRTLDSNDAAGFWQVTEKTRCAGPAFAGCRGSPASKPDRVARNISVHRRVWPDVVKFFRVIQPVQAADRAPARLERYLGVFVDGRAVIARERRHAQAASG